MEPSSDTNVFSAMQTEKPYKSYRKTILGQVYVKILNPFNPNEVQGVILSGEVNTEDSAILDIWSPKEDVFLKTMNKKHFEGGYLMEFERPSSRKVKEAEKYNTLNDEELKKLLSSKFFTLQAGVNKMTTEAPLYRLLIFAKEQEKSEKIIKLIKGRLAEIQSLDASPQVIGE